MFPPTRSPSAASARSTNPAGLPPAAGRGSAKRNRPCAQASLLAGRAPRALLNVVASPFAILARKKNVCGSRKNPLRVPRVARQNRAAPPAGASSGVSGVDLPDCDTIVVLYLIYTFTY